MLNKAMHPYLYVKIPPIADLRFRFKWQKKRNGSRDSDKQIN